MDHKQLNKKGMLMRDYVIMLVLFGVIAGIGGLIVSDMSSPEYGYNITNMSDPSFDSAYNRATETQQLAEQMGNASTSKEGLETIGGLELLFGSTRTVIQLVAGSFNMIRETSASMAMSFGIPLEIANLLFGAIISILIIIIVFVIVSSLTKTKM
jgi:vacuolar-type H+-ATPase subunit I/STV1